MLRRFTKASWELKHALNFQQEGVGRLLRDLAVIFFFSRLPCNAGWLLDLRVFFAGKKRPLGSLKHAIEYMGCSKNGSRKVAWVSWDVMSRPRYMGGLGFRDLKLFSLALLARQAWRVLPDPHTLSARILKSVYFPQTTILEASLGSQPS